jgi:Ca2+-binding RTX toxin-like protein
MHPLPRRTGALAAGTALAALALGVAAQPGAAAGPKAIVSSTASGGLTYVGTDGSNRIEVRVSPAAAPAPKFTIDDIVPIQAGAGCALVPGDETKVTCTAFKNPDGSFKRFHMFGRGGPDEISNFSGVPMTAFGELGRDDLSGGSGPDVLDGGPGDFDTLQGNTGADTFDGGPGEHDGVTYSSRSSATSVTLDGVADDGRTDEKDNVLSSVEDIVGSTVGDVLIGSDADNTIVAGRGDDYVFAGRGADTVIGNQGSDFLSSSADFAGTPLNDGAVDHVSGAGLFSDDGEATTDTCLIGPLDGDVKKFCDQ